MRKLKGFTLVEILIVIVIIGILIGALVPRMSAAQGRARDVARKNDLSNLQAAIVVAYQDLGRYPCTNTKGCENGDELPSTSDQVGYFARDGMDIREFKSKLESAGMNTVPKDPLGTNIVYGLGDEGQNPVAGEYRYLTVESHGIPNGGFVLMAKTEIAGSSNWVVCTEMNENGEVEFTENDNGNINSGMDVKNLRTCDSIVKGTGCSNAVETTADGVETSRTCTYKDERDLRYIVMY